MTVDHVLDLAREALWLTLMISAPLLAAGLVVGLVIGIVQAVTQVQEQTLSFVPKIIAIILTLAAIMPWLLTHLLEYTSALIRGIPSSL